ncbi:hypothetical protein QCA50_004935 [Cerrena zonata]|uniref:DUF6535 domain-containing protein n=1 Tax=Cerrena zonata TaxID=2478898 RepID=A0AAW0GDS2_9APHY
MVSDQKPDWAALERAIREVDETKIKDFKEDIDTLLVFAGLFSAVTTTFLVDSYKSLQSDSAATTNILLARMLLQSQNSLTGIPDTISLDQDLACIVTSTCSFEPPLAAKRVNVLWFSSLIISLIAVSLGMLVKQWLREFLAGEYTSPQIRIRVRFFRYTGLLNWGVFEVVGILPILLQISLGLFLVGMCFFTRSVNHTVGFVSLPLVTVWGSILVIATLAPAFSPRCPYKTTFLKDTMKSARSFLYDNFPPLRPIYEMCMTNPFTQHVIRRKPTPTQPFEEESLIAMGLGGDLDIFVALDGLQVDDVLLSSTIINSLATEYTQQSQGSFQEEHIMRFLLKVLEHRVGHPLSMSEQTRFDLRGRINLLAWTSVVETISMILRCHITQSTADDVDGDTTWPTWVSCAIVILLSQVGFALPDSGYEALVACLRSKPQATAHVIWLCLPSPTNPNYSTIYMNAHTDSVGHPCQDLRVLLGRLHGEDLLSSLNALCGYRSQHDQHVSLMELCNEIMHDTDTTLTMHSNVARDWWESPSDMCTSILDLLIAEVYSALSTPSLHDHQNWVIQAGLITFSHYRRWTAKHIRSTILLLTSESDTARLIRCFQLFVKFDEDVSATASIDAISYVYSKHMNLDERVSMADKFTQMFRTLTQHERYSFNYLLVAELVMILILEEKARPERDPNGPQLINPWLWLSESIAMCSRVYNWHTLLEQDRERVTRCFKLFEKCTEELTSSNSHPSLYALTSVMRGIAETAPTQN